MPDNEPAVTEGTGQLGEGERPSESPTDESTASPDEVQRLKDENAQRRISEREATERADKYRQRLLDYAVKEAASGLLEDWEDAFNAGNPDEDWADDEDPDTFDVNKIRASVEALLESKPHLRKRQPPRGDAGQGPRPDASSDPSERFAEALKQAAG